MPLITQGKTNWKFLLIVIVLTVIVGGLIWFLANLTPEEPVIPEEEIPEEIEDETADWQAYIDEEYGFSMYLPQGWNIIEEKPEISQDGEVTFITFSFIPPEGIPSGWEFWGVLFISVYPYQASPDEWIAEYLPDYENKLNVEQIEELGGKPTFLLDSASEEIFFSPRSLVLGNEYSYIYGFSQDGAPNFTERIKEEIFPRINIK